MNLYLSRAKGGNEVEEETKQRRGRNEQSRGRGRTEAEQRKIGRAPRAMRYEKEQAGALLGSRSFIGSARRVSARNNSRHAHTNKKRERVEHLARRQQAPHGV